jgi:hypothetical protein
MQTVFAIAVGTAIRFIRAESVQEAETLAKEVWGAAIKVMDNIGQCAPDIGQRGYKLAANRKEERVPYKEVKPWYAKEDKHELFLQRLAALGM